METVNSLYIIMITEYVFLEGSLSSTIIISW